MHVAAVQVFEAGPLKTRDGGVDFEAFKRRVAALLHLAPRCRQRLEWTPFEHHPIWVDDCGFDIDEHVLLTRLPRPGTDEQFKAFSAEILEHQLDRSRPLWELWVVEGLPGDRFAVVSKFHHCMIDGALGADLLSILFSPSPEKTTDAPEPYFPRRSPRGWELSRDSWQRWMDMPGDAIRAARKFSRDTTTPWEDLATGAGSVGSLMGWAVRPASDSPLNGTLDARRRIDWTSTPLEDVRAVGNAAGCSLNDVVLATVAGAVRRFLIERGTPADIDFRISAPINTRRSGEEKLPGNHVSAWIVALPTGEKDPSRRMTAIAGATRELKRGRGGLGMEWLTAAAEWAPSAMLSLGVRLASGPINMVVTNVKGPSFPLFMLGARLEALYPVVPLLEGSALGIALFSYNGTLMWGFNAGHDLLPDLGSFVAHIDESFAELAGAFGVRTTVPSNSLPKPSEPYRPEPGWTGETFIASP